MLLRLFAIGSCSIAVGAFIENEYRIVGLIPKGMIHHLEKILEEQDDYCIQIDCTNCSQLEMRCGFQLYRLDLCLTSMRLKASLNQRISFYHARNNQEQWSSDKWRFSNNS
jgi:hypothetical protein